MTNDAISRARELRQRQTKAESLLWNVLRGKRLCNKKFRRQQPIDPFFADFACVELKLIIEIDGGYHDYLVEDDVHRQSYLERKGWRVLRYTNEQVIENVEAVAIAIAKEFGLEPEFRARVAVRSGMRMEKSEKPR